jgi:para-aminobenzoate synthetase component 1
MTDRPFAWFDGRLATGLVEVSADPADLDCEGWWAVVLPYDGPPVLALFSEVADADLPDGPWRGPSPDAWSTSLDHDRYVDAVAWVRQRIARGEVYQANVCRVLSAVLPDPSHAHPAGLARLLRAGNPAPYAGVVHLPDGCHPQVPAGGLSVVTASPELYLERHGARVRSGPIKGTGREVGDLAEKDSAENVMIVDLVRNDLGIVCETGSVTVPALLSVEEHPGLVHLVSYVEGDLVASAGWTEILGATFPPGSVTGAPKSTALRIIADVEPESRGPYCGAVGWVDASARSARLAVAIRTFWLTGDRLRFGTGAGITWGSDAELEWAETELKAARLLAVAAGAWEGDRS